jgi:hypothetical protein
VKTQEDLGEVFYGRDSHFSERERERESNVLQQH